MHEYKLLEVGPKEREIETFTAANTKEACIKHMAAWKTRKTSYAVVLVLPNGARNSYRDSEAYASVSI